MPGDIKEENLRYILVLFQFSFPPKNLSCQSSTCAGSQKYEKFTVSFWDKIRKQLQLDFFRCFAVLEIVVDAPKKSRTAKNAFTGVRTAGQRENSSLNFFLPILHILCARPGSNPRRQQLTASQTANPLGHPGSKTLSTCTIPRNRRGVCTPHAAVRQVLWCEPEVRETENPEPNKKKEAGI